MCTKRNSYLNDRSLSLAAKGLMAVLMETGGADPNDLGTISDAVGESYAGVYFDELCNKGYIIYDYDSGAGKAYYTLAPEGIDTDAYYGRQEEA